MFTEEQKLIIGITVIVYFFFLFGTAVFINRRVKTYDDYNVAGRTVSMYPLILTFIGTAVGGSILLGYMTDGYRLGMGQLWLGFSLGIPMLLMGFFLLTRIRKLGEKYNMVTMGDYTALRYGEGARIPTVIAVLCAYCAITGMQFVSIATILNLTNGLNMTIGILIGWVLLTMKTYFGGLKAVIWQDAVHGTIQTVGIFVLFVVVILASGGWEGISQNAQSLGEAESLSIFNISTTELAVLFLTLGAYQFVRQDVWQRFWAAKSLKVAKNGFLLSAVLAIITSVITVAIGVFANYGLRIDNIDPALVYYYVVGDVFPFPLVIVMMIALLATVISCADSFFLAASSSIVNDLIKPRLKDENKTKNMLLYSRMSVGIVSLISVLLALYIPQLVQLWITGTAMLVSALLAPIVIGLFWKRPTRKAGLASMWTGLVVAVIWQLAGHPFGWHPVFLGLPISIIVLLAVTFMTKPESNIIEEIQEDTPAQRKTS
ncbi:sodium:solute symporter family protein [Alteribacillus iranensis]|uniref:Transporter, SSS family n=1 Tax=Alteribacillus iranensis TaxID=930128 RepID=A0A1I2B3Q9_9BACI|nr:sodium:solute symporter family protein [Alteribacillus iranensis]SFE50815.1 transporter, SSS family [Alteribacillus iranensis]